MNIVNEFSDLIRKENNFDVSKRDLSFYVNQNKQINISLFYSNFIVDMVKVNTIIESLNEIKLYEININKQILNHLVNESVVEINNLVDACNNFYNGQLIIIIEEEHKIISADCRKYPGRLIGEPDSEKVVRGSRDGFTESMAINLGLIRMRIKSNKLNVERYEIGNYSKTNVLLIYFQDEIDTKIINHVKENLRKIDIKELTMSDKALEELLVNSKSSIYPLVKYTERPDTFVAHLYQGMFGIIVDTSPSAILGPVSIFDHMQHAEEYRQTMIAGSYLRFIRFIGIIFTYLLIPVWFMCIKENLSIGLFPKLFNIESSINKLFIELILIELGIELVRMASIHTPSALATSMGLIAGVVIGDLAIEAGIFSNNVVLLGSLSAIGSYITPSYELSLANKIMKIGLIVLTYLFSFWGLIFGLLIQIIYLVNLKSFTRSYLYPLIPFNFKKLLKQIFRTSYIKNN